ncbi:MAG: beta-propeller fold lactonase family protein [Bryobacteraceae bacterium]
MQRPSIIRRKSGTFGRLQPNWENSAPENPSASCAVSSSNLLNRRELLALSSFSALVSCGSRSATGYPGFALVTIAAENSLSLVNLNTFRLARKLDLHSPPSRVISDGENAYVLTPRDGTLHVIDPNRAVHESSVRLANELDLLCLAQIPQRLVAVSCAARELILAELPNLTPLRRVRLATPPIDLDVRSHSISKRTYAALSGGTAGTIEIVNLLSGERRKREFPAELGSLRFRDDGQLLFVANYSQKSLLVLDSETLDTVCELSLPMRPQNFSFGADHGQLFISGPGMDGISIVYVYKTIEVDQTILAGREPGAMACSDNPRYLFVASRAGSEIIILDIDSRKMVGLTQVGDKPSRIVITPDQQYALILNEGSGDLAVIRIPNIQGNRSRNGASSLPAKIVTLRGVSLFAMIAVGQNPVDLAIVNQRA